MHCAFSTGDRSITIKCIFFRRREKSALYVRVYAVYKALGMKEVA